MRLSWDQGTLLLYAEPGVNLRDPPGMLWDPRVGAWRAPGSSHPAVAAWLAASHPGFRDEVLDTLRPPGGAAPSLRAYQDAAVGAWALAGQRGLVVLPTGAGKTRTALACLARAGTSALILVPTRVLLEQWVAALGEAGFGPVGRYGDGERRLEPVTVSTFASARRHIGEIGRRFGLLVVDEAHHFGGGSGDEALELCAAAARLGLSATPPEGSRLQRLGELLGPVVYRSSIEELAGRFLAPFHLVTLTLPLSPAERTVYEAEVAVWRPLVRQFFDRVPEATWPDFVASASTNETGRRALVSWRNSRALLRLPESKISTVGKLVTRHHEGRVLVFAPDAVSAIQLSRLHLIPAITADIGRAERERILSRFAAGSLRSIVSARVLNEGVDVPAADVAVIVGGSAGEREYVQRVGRVLRPEPGKEAIIYELLVQGAGELHRLEARRMQLGAA